MEMGRQEPNTEELQQNGTKPAIKKGNLQDNGGQEIRQLYLQVSSEEQGSGPPCGGQVLQGGVTVQSYEADTQAEAVDSDDSIELWKPHQKSRRVEDLGQPLLSGGGGKYAGRLRSRTVIAKKINGDLINHELIEFSDDGSEGYGEDIGNRLRAAKPQFLWGSKKRRNSREHGRITMWQENLTSWLKECRMRLGEKKNPQSYAWYDSREALPAAPTQLQHEIPCSKEKHPGQSLYQENVVSGNRSGSQPSSLGRIGSSYELNMVTHIESFPRELGGRHEGAPATPMKSSIRKRKAGILVDGFPEANGFDASNRRPRSNGTNRAVQKQNYQLSSSRDEVAEHSRRQVADLLEEMPLQSTNLPFHNSPEAEMDAFVNGEFARGDLLDNNLEALLSGEFCRPGTFVHGAQFSSGRETSSIFSLDDPVAYIGSQSHINSEQGECVPDRDAFGIAGEPSTNKSLGTPQSEARHFPPGGDFPFQSKTDNVGSPIPTSSYHTKARRSLSFSTDGATQRVGSISTLSSDVQLPPAPPNNAPQPLSNSSPVVHDNPIPNNQHGSLGTAVAPSMNDVCKGVLEGREDFEPDYGNLLEEEEEEEEGEEGLLDLNEPPEQQNQPQKNPRARKKHRPKVFREGRPDKRRKAKNVEENVSKTKASEGKKVDGGRKKRATADFQPAQGNIGKQAEHFMPVAANCGPAIDGCAQYRENKCSDAPSCRHSEERRAIGTEDILQSRGESGVSLKESAQTPIRGDILVMGPNNSLIRERVFGNTSSPADRDCSPLCTSASASPSTSIKKTGEADHLTVTDSPLGRARRELFKRARSKRSRPTGKDGLEFGEKRQESVHEATVHPIVVSAAKTLGAGSRERTDATHSQELVTIESQEQSMGEAVFHPASEVAGSQLSLKLNATNSDEGVSGESRIVPIDAGFKNGSSTFLEEIALEVVYGRVSSAAPAKPNLSNGVKRSYTRRAPSMPRRPKQTDITRALGLVANRMANLGLDDIDSGLQLVPHANQNTALVSYDGPFVPLRRKKPRAKVMLDGEDKRVWRLLMTKGTNFDDDNSDKEAPRQWEEERATMKAQAEKFINLMHLVQGDRRFSVWKGSVVDSVVGAFLTQNVSDHLSSSAFMCLAARFPVLRKKKAATETSQEATVTEVQVEETLEIGQEASGIPVSSDGTEAVQKGSITAFHIEEPFDISEKSSGTGEGSPICYNQQAHDPLSTKLTDSEGSPEPTTESLQKVVASTSQDHEGMAWHYHIEERSTDTREQNSSCSSKTSQSPCYSHGHHATSRGDSLEVRESEEQKTSGVREDYTSLHSGPVDALSASAGRGHMNFFNSAALVEVGERVVRPNSWIQTDPGLSLIVDLGLTLADHMMDTDSPRKASRDSFQAHANSPRIHESGGNSDPQEKNYSSVSQDLDLICAAPEEVAASSGSVVSSSDSFDAHNLSKTSAIPGSDIHCVIGDEIGANRAGVAFPIDCFDTTNKPNDEQLVISSAVLLSEDANKQLHGGISYATDPSSPLRFLKSFMRKKVQAMTKGRQKTGAKALYVNGTNNSDLVNTSDDQEKKVRSKRPVISLTGIARARLEQANTSSKVAVNWEAVRLKHTRPAKGENQPESAHAGCQSFGSSGVENGVDWDAVRSAKLEDIANVIKERGMHNVLAGRIKAFLERVQKEHGSVDLEWLRTVSVEEAKSFLLSIRGLGLKSVECIRLLTLHHLAFPVDTNVGRICVRLGWVPLEPLPEELQLHLLELYPVQETIQKYLWPRLCTLDQRTLYELHYQMITFGKVFCTKSRPNCNACPMREDCQHFKSALASAKLALPVAAHEDSHSTNSEPLALPAAAAEFVRKTKLALQPLEHDDVAGEEGAPPLKLKYFTLAEKLCEPIIEEPRTPEPEIEDIEQLLEKHEDYDTFVGVSSQPFGSDKGSSSEIEIVLPPAEVSILDTASKALVLLPPDSAYIPVPKLKNVGRLRTVHYVYELPDSHPLVQEMDPREEDDPCCYLLAIWSPGESPQAPPVLDDMYTNGTCDGFNSSEEETVKGTVLVPCRTAMRGIFPLNGTYFQVNEVFADHASSLQPIEVPRTLLWNLRRRFVYFGTSVTTIFKGLSTREIQACFWRGYVCVRGFDSLSRCPRPLVARLHFPASKLVKKQKDEKNSDLNAEA